MLRLTDKVPALVGCPELRPDFREKASSFNKIPRKESDTLEGENPISTLFVLTYKELLAHLLHIGRKEDACEEDLVTVTL